MKITIENAKNLAQSALQSAGASIAQAAPTANALVMADAMGLASHGLSRIPMYVGHLQNNRVDGQAEPKIIKENTNSVLIDAADGFAFPACAMASSYAIIMAKSGGISMAAVTNSHHFGAAGLLLQEIADAGMIGVAFGNSPAAMAFPGGKRPILGTNPIAAIFPRFGVNNDSETALDPILIDLSLSEVARGKIMMAAKKGEPIPLGWALDKDGNPTQDANAALMGSMLPFGSGGSESGGVKGAMLALMIEMLAISLTGAHFGAEADSFFQDQGNKPKIAQIILAINPLALITKSVYVERINALLDAILADGTGDNPTVRINNIRLPGARRFELLRAARQNGIEISELLYQQIRGK